MSNSFRIVDWFKVKNFPAGRRLNATYIFQYPVSSQNIIQTKLKKKSKSQKRCGVMQIPFDCKKNTTNDSKGMGMSLSSYCFKRILIIFSFWSIVGFFFI